MGEYAASVFGYIQWCMEEVMVIKPIITWANQKPWMTMEVLKRQRKREAAFKSGNAKMLRSARADPNRVIRVAKRDHSQKIQGFFKDSCKTTQLWQVIKSVADYRAAPTPFLNDIGFLDKLNNFFGRFVLNPVRSYLPTLMSRHSGWKPLLC